MSPEISLRQQLEKSRSDLLDLTTRNRLISTSRLSHSTRLEIMDELSEEVFETLVSEKKTMSFLPSRADREDVGAAGPSLWLAQPEDDCSEVASRHTDRNLQTSLSSEKLQRRLLKLYYDARTFQEEQGVNILYLALGFLKWYEDEKTDRERFAPLLLVPVELDRSSASARFRLSFTEDEIATNLSLQAKLKIDFGIGFPDVPDIEELSATPYFDAVQTAVSNQPRWEVLRNDIVLWFFSFSKFLMYRDLQPENWPGERNIEGHALLQGLLQDGFRCEDPICSDSDSVDDVIAPRDMIHVVDADSSQALVIEEVRRGRNLVIQGPPGTGKSQTIANLMATAVRNGKTVLFVSEKMAALEVVKRRLDNIHLGDMCLELHSHSANKRAVLEDLRRTLELGEPRAGDVAAHSDELQEYRDRLNRHATMMHSYLEPAHVTPYQMIGELVRLRSEGKPPADFTLSQALQWMPRDMRDRRSALEDLVVHAEKVGNPREHPWRGVGLDSILTPERDRIAQKLSLILSMLDRLILASERLGKLLQYGTTNTLLDCSAVAQIGQRFLKAPPMDRATIAHRIWSERPQDIERLVQTGRNLQTLRSSLDLKCAQVAWSTDVAEARRHLAAHGRGLFRLFNRDYRRAQATLRGILKDAPPKSLDERLQILDALIGAQSARDALDADEPLASAAFGSAWRGADSDWPALEKIGKWASECRTAKTPRPCLEAFSVNNDLAQVGYELKAIGSELKPLFEELSVLFQRIELDLAEAFGKPDVRTISLRAVKSRIQSWLDNQEGITDWIAYSLRKRRLESLGLEEITRRIHEGVLAPGQATGRFDAAYFEALMVEACQRYPELATFDGVSHERIMRRFRQLDNERMALARQEVARAHFERMPKHGADAGELGVLRKEMKKKQRHLPLRRLLKDAGHAVQHIKPVFMMSPISVAQFLEPGVLEFDLLLIDEASQVRPVDAIGAVARARQIVVVGDDRQLPPTNFFGRMLGEDPDADEDEFQTRDLESILGLCEAQRMPQRMLRWHYRSRHHSLIAVSNREFYDDKLYVVPSPFSRNPEFGLCFRHVSDGVFDRGGSSTNRVEARAVAEAVMIHAIESPELSLGVGAFSVKQRDAILDELELLRREKPDLELFFASDVPEPFFVKNLENIQGDERDVIFISVGYARDASGYMAMNFGPLNSEGGERRLNVLISRAKQRCEVFSSITADDIDLNRTRSRGAQALKTFLAYAKSGILGAAEGCLGDCESEFEAEVRRKIESLGYKVDAQVGVAGFRVDLAVADPECPGRYLLGIECDGAAYHSSRSARDRDRLRQQVLEDRGWIIYRIWSTDWFHRPETELAHVQAAIENAKAALTCGEVKTRFEARSIKAFAQKDAIDRREPQQEDAGSVSFAETVEYVEAKFLPPFHTEIQYTPPHQLADLVARVVAVEGPIHRDEILRRVATICGTRLGKRVQAAIAEGVQIALRSGELVCDREFFSSLTQHDFPIRNRANVASVNLRKPEFLPYGEIQQATLAVVQSHLGISSDEAATLATRLLGLKSTTQELRRVIDHEIEVLVEKGQLDRRNAKLYVCQPTDQPASVS